MSESTYLSLREVAAMAPGRPHVSAVWRWARKGCLARNGERIKLKHSRVGSRLFIPMGALEEFAEALAEADAAYFDAPAPPTENPKATAKSRTATQRDRDVAAAKSRLRQRGVAV